MAHGGRDASITMHPLFRARTGRGSRPEPPIRTTRLVHRRARRSSSERDGDLDVWVMNADGSQQTNVTNDDPWAAQILC